MISWQRLTRFGLTARAGLADTPGAAHALARYAASPAIALAGTTQNAPGALARRGVAAFP